MVEELSQVASTVQGGSPHLSLDVRGVIAMKDEAKAEVLDAFFAMAIISKASCSQGT